MRRVFILIIMLSIVTLAFRGFASEEEGGEEIKLYLGEAKIISANRPSRIAIGNPNVVDVSSVTKSEITLNPKGIGTTTLVVWDSFGEQAYKIKVFTEDIDALKRRIDTLLATLDLPEVKTQAAEEEGKIILLGRIKSAQDKERIAGALGSLLKEKIIDLIQIKEEESIVDIDVQVLELTKDATNTLGFTWPGSVSMSTDTEPGAEDFKGIPLTKWSTLFHVTNWSRTNFKWTLDALVQEGKARILSRPRLACQSGKEAELIVGGEKPIFMTGIVTTGTSTTSITYKEYGIKLKIIPTVTAQDRLKLGLKVEVSEVGAADTIGDPSAPTAKAYPLTKRTASTELFLNDGQTLAIGGLVRQTNEEDVTKTPFLGDVPVLGALFRKKTTKVGGGQGERGSRELFITLTPKIMAEAKAAGEAETKKEIKLAQTSPAVFLGNISDPISGYAQIIQKRILSNLVYPVLAKEAGFQGTVRLGLRLSYLGELLEARVKSSSGHKILDDNTISVAKGITSYPPFPSSIKEKEIWIEVPIVYRLD